MSTPKKTKKFPAEFFWLVCLILVGAGLRLYDLGGTSLWKDEIFSLIRSNQPLSDILLGELPFGLRMPLHHIFIHIALVFGKTEFIVRLPSVLFGLASIVLIYKLGDFIFNNKKIGLISAFFLTISPLHLEYSREARYYSFLIFFSLLSFLFFYKIISEKKLKWVWLFLLVTILNVTTHVGGLLLLGAQVISILFIEWPHLRKLYGKNKSLSLIIASLWKNKILLTLGLLFILMIFFSFKNISQLLQAIKFGPIMPPLDFLNDILERTSGNAFSRAVISSFFFLAGLTAILHRRQRKEAFLLITLLFPLIIVYFMRPAMFGFNIRHVLFFRIPYILIASLGMATLLRFKFGLVLGAVIFAIVSMEPIQELYQIRKGDWRGVGEYLSANAKPGDVLVVENATNRALLDYYLEVSKRGIILKTAAESLTPAKIPFRIFFHQHDYSLGAKPNPKEIFLIDYEKLVPFDSQAEVSPMYLFISRPIYFWQEGGVGFVENTGWDVSNFWTQKVISADSLKFPDAQITYKTVVPEDGYYRLYAGLRWDNVQGILKYKVDKGEWSSGFQPFYDESGNIPKWQMHEKKLGTFYLKSGEHLITFLNQGTEDGRGHYQMIDYFYLTK